MASDIAPYMLIEIKKWWECILSTENRKYLISDYLQYERMHRIITFVLLQDHLIQNVFTLIMWHKLESLLMFCYL